LPRFDRVIVADWSAAASPSPARPSANAIWLGIAGPEGMTTRYFRTRAAAEAAIVAEIAANHGRLLIGFDFPMGYPTGFAAALTGQASARAVWRWLAEYLTDGPDNRNNRFTLAATINARFPAGPGPFWGRPMSLPLPDLPTTKAVSYPALGLAERRMVERRVPRAQPVWKLYTTGAAGGQGLVGQAMIHRLCQLPGVAVWPFDTADAAVVLAEVYPSLLSRAVAADAAPIRDEVQVRLLARALWHLSQTGGLAALLCEPPVEVQRDEGWILGAGQVAALEAAL
jgi:hypothetical protein